MRGVVAVVVCLGPGDGEAAIENVLEAEYRAVGKHEALESRWRIRVEVIEARQLHRSGIAKVQDHRARTDSHRLRIEALPESQRARFGPGRIIEDLITPIASSENVRVLSRTSYEDVIARATYQDVIAAVALQKVVPRATVQVIVACAGDPSRHQVVADKDIVSATAEEHIASLFTEERVFSRAALYIVVSKSAECPTVSRAAVDDVHATGGVIAGDFRVGERHLEDGSPLQHGARHVPIESRDIKRAITIEIVVATAADDHVVASTPEEEIRGTAANQHIVASIPGHQVGGTGIGQRGITRADGRVERQCLPDARIAVEDVVASIASENVALRATFDPVVTASRRDRVSICARLDQVIATHRRRGAC